MSPGWCIALWLVMGPQAAPPPSSAAAATARALAELAHTARSLAALPAPDGSRMPDSLKPTPLEAELDRTLHRQFGDFVEAWLREHRAAAQESNLDDELAAELVEELARADVVHATSGEADDAGANARLAGPWSGLVSLEVVRVEDDPGLVAVSWETPLTSLGDASLYVLTIDRGRVERVLEWSAELAEWPDLGDRRGSAEPLPFGLTDVLNNFRFDLSARDERGRFFVATAWSVPSPPHSSWGTASWALLGSGSHPRAPRVLARGSDSVYECGLDCPTVNLEGGFVTLDYEGRGGGLANCSGGDKRWVWRRWRLVDGGAEELAPTDDPFDFLDAWIDAPWWQARGWSTPGWNAQGWHRLLQRVACKVGPVGPNGRRADTCRYAGAGREVVEVVLFGSLAQDVTGRDAPFPLYFVVDTSGASLQLLGITTRMPDGEWQKRWPELNDCADVSPDGP